MGNGYLFNTFILDDYLNKQKQNMLSRISREDKAYLASINIDEYLTYLQNSYEISLPIIDESNIYIDKKVSFILLTLVYNLCIIISKLGKTN